jgi:predicted molibdopterin-dependent oxidoreductase YjgC
MIAPRQITLTIDGRRCAGQEGQTILQIAEANGIFIPTLCYLKHLSPWGGCRMCIVEIVGSPKVVPACSTPAKDGEQVNTHSEYLKKLRRHTLELLFSERNHICPFCVMNHGDCELQQQGYRHGIEAIRFPYLYPAWPVDVSGKYVALDHNRCILCTRCVRTCEEMEGVHTLDISHRGGKNHVVVDLGATFGTSDTCTSCGACVAACPTGALFDKAAAFRGKLGACQIIRTTCSECPVGCGLLVYTKENRIVEVFGDFDSPVNQGHLCARGRYETWAEPRRRILQPLLRRHEELEPATWEEAIKAVRDAAKKARPAQRAVLVSPRLNNETVATLKKFGRLGVFVAQNEAALCAEGNHGADGMAKLHDADAIIVLGAQPSGAQGVVAAKIRTTVRLRGAKLLVFHTRKSDLDQYADICANVVGLEHKFWEQVAGVLRDARRPVLVYGPEAMTPIGVAVLERLVKIFEAKTSGPAPALIALPTGPNSRALAAGGVELVEEVGPWLDAKPLKFLHIVASDEPDGGARLLDEKYVRALMEEIDCVVVQAAYQSRLTDLAKVVLPAAIWSEKTGTLTNFEGRELPLRAVLPPRGEARQDQEILEALMV